MQIEWDKKELAQRLEKVSLLRGSFKLRSGQTSSFYFDKYRFESDPKLLFHIAYYLKSFIPKDIDLLAGLEMGGLPLATALSLQTNIPCVFIRKQAKSYGTCSFAEGQKVSGKKLLLVEDVVTTGGQVLLSFEDLKKEGALVDSAVCVINRGGAGKLPLKLYSLFALDDFNGDWASLKK